MIVSPRSLLLISALCGLLFSTRAPAQTFSIQVLSPDSATSATTICVNNRGQAVGNYSDGTTQKSFIWTVENGFQDLGIFPGYPSGLPYSTSVSWINVVGQVVGEATTADAKKHAFLWEKGVMKDLGTLGGESSKAMTIDDNGDIYGLSLPPTGTYPHATRWKGTEITDLLPDSLADSWICGTNSAGTLIGNRCIDAATGDHRAFTMDATGVHDLAPLQGDTDSEARAINKTGTVGGSSGKHAENKSHAIIWTYWGYVADLPPFEGDTNSTITYINGHLQCVGISWNDKEKHPFMFFGGSPFPVSMVLSPDNKLTITEIYTLTDRGQMAGAAIDTNGVQRAILLSPMYGDINRNFQVDMGDLVGILKMAAGMSDVPCMCLIDMWPYPTDDPRGYGDELITMEDVIRIVRHMNGLETHWP